MRCPVCKSEYGEVHACPHCGFDQLQVEFLSRDEAEEWINAVVVPYREKWEASQLPTTVDWAEILFRQKDVKYFFDVTLLAAAKQNEVVGHTLLICPYPRLRNCFLEQLAKYLPYREIKDRSTPQKMKMGDLAAALTNLQEGDICILNAKSLPSGKEFDADLSAAFKEFALIVRIGKGPAANDVRLDLPAFTWLALVDKKPDMPYKFVPVFENIIEIKADKQEMCELEIRAAAADIGMRVHQAAVAYIAAQVKYDVHHATNCVKRISDYMLVKDFSGQMVTEEMAKEILSQFM